MEHVASKTRRRARSVFQIVLLSRAPSPTHCVSLPTQKGLTLTLALCARLCTPQSTDKTLICTISAGLITFWTPLYDDIAHARTTLIEWLKRQREQQHRSTIIWFSACSCIFSTNTLTLSSFHPCIYILLRSTSCRDYDSPASETSRPRVEERQVSCPDPFHSSQAHQHLPAFACLFSSQSLGMREGYHMAIAPSSWKNKNTRLKIAPATLLHTYS